MGKEIEDADHLTCPYCGHIDMDCDEMFEEGSDERDVHCTSCGKNFLAVKVLEVHYSSFPLEDEPGAA